MIFSRWRLELDVKCWSKCSHLDMELSEVRSLGERIVLKLRLGCDTAQHKRTKPRSVNEASVKKTALTNTTVHSGVEREIGAVAQTT